MSNMRFMSNSQMSSFNMIENNIDNVKDRIKDITLKIDFHENRLAMHRSAIKKLRNERAVLMKALKGRDEDRKETK